MKHTYLTLTLVFLFFIQSFNSFPHSNVYISTAINEATVIVDDKSKKDSSQQQNDNNTDQYPDENLNDDSTVHSDSDEDLDDIPDDFYDYQEENF